jgi:DNA-binding MarR family transcriptional regulator
MTVMVSESSEEGLESAGVPGPRRVTRSRPDRSSLLAALNWESRRTSVFFGLLNRAVAARLGIHVTDVEALGVLGVVGSTSPTHLAGLLGMGTGTVTLVIDRLERAGFVRRVRAGTDRRSVSVEVTEGRQQEMAALYAPLLEAARTISSTYSDRDLAIIVGYLERSNEMLRDVSRTLADEEGRNDRSRLA